MNRVFNLIFGAGLITLAASQEYYEGRNTAYKGEDGRDVATHDAEGIGYERDYIVNKGDARDYEVEDSRDNVREQDSRLAASYDHGREFKKADKCFQKCGTACGQGFHRGEGNERSEINRFRINENGKEIAECSENCGRRKKGNFHEECIEERGKLQATNDKKSGERIKADKCIQRKKARRGFNEREGEGKRETFVKGCGKNFGKSNLRKCAQEHRVGNRSFQDGSLINLQKKARDVGVDERAQHEREVDVNRRDQEIVDRGVYGDADREFEVRRGVEARSGRVYDQDAGYYGQGRDYEVNRRD